jgi:hypothetical protein
MKTLGIALTAVSLALSAPALAQTSNNPQPMQESPASLTQQNNSTQWPEQMGNTGWSGPHRGPTSDSTVAAPTPSDSPDKQPLVATGADLSGPAKAFPSNKAPE